MVIKVIKPGGLSNLKEKINNEKVRRIFEEMKGDALSLLEDFHDDLSEGGWIHSYFCKECFSQLIFDRKNDGEFKCPHCGRVYRDDKLKKAWKINYREHIARTLPFVAFLYHLEKKEEYLSSIYRVFDFYKDNYEKFPIYSRKPEWKAHLGVQPLNEALILSRFLEAIAFLPIDDHYKEELFEKLFYPSYELLKGQVVSRINIDLWLLSYLGMIGIVFEKKDILDYSLYGERGILNVLKRSLTGEGIWYEGSFHYHFFALKALSVFYCLHKNVEKDSIKEIEEALLKGLMAPIHMVFPDGRFPNPGDGWPYIGPSTYVETYEYGHELFPHQHNLDNILRCIYNGKFKDAKDIPVYEIRATKGYLYERFILKSVTDYTCDIDLEKERTVFTPGESIFIKKGLWSIYLKAGHFATNHAHKDIGNYEIYYGSYPVTVDLSNIGYGIKNTNTYFREAISHNTFMIEGKGIGIYQPIDIKRVKDGYGFYYPFTEGFFERYIDIEKTLKIKDKIDAKGKRIGIVFHTMEAPYNLDKIPSPDSSIIPEIDGKDEVSWYYKGVLNNEISIDFPHFVLNIKSNSPVSLFIGEGYWIPRDVKITIFYIEGVEKLETQIMFEGKKWKQ